MLLVFLIFALFLGACTAGTWANAATVSDEISPECGSDYPICSKHRTYNTYIAPQDRVSSVPNLVGGPYAGSNVSKGGYVILTDAGLFAGTSFVADGSTTGNLSINFNLDNDPALSLTCPNGQTGMKMTTQPGSCLRRVGINLLNPQCSLDVDDAICINGVPIAAGQILPLAWYYQVDQNSPCNTTNVQEYFTPSAIDQVTIEAIDVVFVGYQGGAIAFAADNNTASFGDCRGTNAVDFQLTRLLSTQVASGDRAFIGAGISGTASGVESFVGAGDSNTAAGDRAATLGGQGATVSGSDSASIGGVGASVTGLYSVNLGGNGNSISGDNCAAAGTSIDVQGANDYGFGSSITMTAASSLSFATGTNHNIDASYGSFYAGVGLRSNGNNTLVNSPVQIIIGAYNDPDSLGVATAERVFSIGGGFNDTERNNLFAVLTNADTVIGAGGSVIITGADYQEYFEHSEGAVKLPIGTTVKILDDGMFRKAQQGEIPDGVVSKRGGVLGNSDGGHWVGKYVMDEETGKVKMENGRKIISDKFDEKKTYKPRSVRDEWHTIGLLGQCEVLDGSPVDPRWVPMPKKAGARPGTSWYLIK